MDLDETWQEWSLGQAGQINIAVFAFGCQQAELFGAKARNLGVFAISKGFWWYKDVLEILTGP